MSDTSNYVTYIWVIFIMQNYVLCLMSGYLSGMMFLGFSFILCDVLYNKVMKSVFFLSDCWKTGKSNVREMSNREL